MVDKVTIPTSEALRSQRKEALQKLVDSIHTHLDSEDMEDTQSLAEGAKKFVRYALEEIEASSDGQHIHYSGGLGEDVWWDTTSRKSAVVLRGTKLHGYYNDSATQHIQDQLVWEVLFNDVANPTEEDMVSFHSSVWRSKSVVGSEGVDNYWVDFTRLDFAGDQVIGVVSTKSILLEEGNDPFAPKKPGQFLSTRALHEGLLSINL